MDKDQLDLLKRVEELTSKLNQAFGQRGKMVFARYPLTFGLLVVLGATMVGQGIKDLMLEIPFLHNQPIATLVFGIVILIFTGTLYKKLSK